MIVRKPALEIVKDSKFIQQMIQNSHASIHIEWSKLDTLDRIYRANKENSSRFTNPEMAVEILKYIIARNAEEIDNWLDTNPQTDFEKHLGVKDITIGEGFFRQYNGRVIEKKTSIVFIAFQSEPITPDNPYGIGIRTMYPNMETQKAVTTNRNLLEDIRNTDVYKERDILYKTYMELTADTTERFKDIEINVDYFVNDNDRNALTISEDTMDPKHAYIRMHHNPTDDEVIIPRMPRMQLQDPETQSILINGHPKLLQYANIAYHIRERLQSEGLAKVPLNIKSVADAAKTAKTYEKSDSADKPHGS